MISAVCRYCGKRFERSGIARHIAACSERKVRLEDPGVQRTYYHHLQICDADSRLYWLYILAAPNVTLADLDQLLRSIWLECCHHMSAFTVGERQYVADSDNPFAGTLSRTRIADLPEEARIRYVYDFGSSTALTIRRLKAIEHPVGEQRIEIDARNDPPEFACKCGRNAIAAETTGWEPRYLCRDCLAEFDGDISFVAPLTNSPRFGVCSYYRGEIDIEGDYPGFEEAEEAINALPAVRHANALEGGAEEERRWVVEEYLRLLEGPVEGKSIRRAAAFIDRHFEHFAERLRTIVLDTIERYRADRSEKPTSPGHVVALILVSRRPDAELFTIVVEGLSQRSELHYLWNGALDEPALRRALFASLCSNAPEALVSAIATHEDDPLVRYAASNSLIALYLHELVDRSTIVTAMNELAERAVTNEDAELAELVAGDCLNLYPDDMIRTVQRLHAAGLLDHCGRDYLALVRDILDTEKEQHLARLEFDGFYSLLDDPLRALADALERTRSFRPRTGTSGAAEAGPTSQSRDAGNPATMRPSAHDASRTGGTVARASRKVGRNERCPCGSGRKYKHCCGR